MRDKEQNNLLFFDKISRVFDKFKKYIHITSDSVDGKHRVILCKATDTQWFEKLEVEISKYNDLYMSSTSESSPDKPFERKYDFQFPKLENKNKDDIMNIIIEKDILIPGTDVILEKGDAIKIVPKVTEGDKLDAYIQYVHGLKEYQAYFKEFQKLGYVRFFVDKTEGMRNAQIYEDLVNRRNNFHPEIICRSRDNNKITIQTSSYGALDPSTYEVFIKHVTEGQLAAKLLQKVLDDNRFWDVIPDVAEFVK